MSWLTKTIRKHVPSTRNKSYDIQTGISNFTNTVAGVFDKKHRENFDQATDIFSSGVTKLGNNIFAQDDGSVFGGASKMLSSIRDMRHHNAFGFAGKAADYMIPAKHQDIFKGQPNLSIPNIPMPGTGAIDYLNARTKQLGYVQDKLEMFNSWGNDIIRKGGEVLAHPLGNHPNYHRGGSSTAGATSDPASKIVKGSGSLLGKSAKFVTNKSGKNRGRSSLKIGRGGTGGGEGGDHFKSYKSGRRSEGLYI